jgi:hypothetical protein
MRSPSLVADGLIEATGEFRPRRDGTLAPEYRVTELGRQGAKAKRRRKKGE